MNTTSSTKDMYPVAAAQFKSIELSNRKLIESCPDGVKALRHTALNADLSQEELAISIGKAKKVLSRALNGSAGLPIDVLIKLMRESDSVFLLEYMCQKMGGKFVFESQEDREIQEMKERIALYEMRRTA
jgi:antitoxin component HigA of HigAB toxin-antitoxin module